MSEKLTLEEFKQVLVDLGDVARRSGFKGMVAAAVDQDGTIAAYGGGDKLTALGLCAVLNEHVIKARLKKDEAGNEDPTSPRIKLVPPPTEKPKPSPPEAGFEYLPEGALEKLRAAADPGRLVRHRGPARGLRVQDLLSRLPVPRAESKPRTPAAETDEKKAFPVLRHLVVGGIQNVLLELVAQDRERLTPDRVESPTPELHDILDHERPRALSLETVDDGPGRRAVPIVLRAPAGL